MDETKQQCASAAEQSGAAQAPNQAPNQAPVWFFNPLVIYDALWRTQPRVTSSGTEHGQGPAWWPGLLKKICELMDEWGAMMATSGPVKGLPTSARKMLPVHEWVDWLQHTEWYHQWIKTHRTPWPAGITPGDLRRIFKLAFEGWSSPIHLDWRWEGPVNQPAPAQLVMVDGWHRLYATLLIHHLVRSHPAYWAQAQWPMLFTLPKGYCSQLLQMRQPPAAAGPRTTVLIGAHYSGPTRLEQLRGIGYIFGDGSIDYMFNCDHASTIQLRYARAWETVARLAQHLAASPEVQAREHLKDCWAIQNAQGQLDADEDDAHLKPSLQCRMESLHEAVREVKFVTDNLLYHMAAAKGTEHEWLYSRWLNQSVQRTDAPVTL